MKKLLTALAIAFASAGVMLWLYLSGVPFLELMELKARDVMFKTRDVKSMAGSKVVVVAVGERSLDRLGRWPWPRQRTAKLIQAIVKQGAGSLGLDMGFFEPDNTVHFKTAINLAQAAKMGKPLSLEEMVQRFHQDYILAQAVAENRGQVVLGYFFHTEGLQVAHLDKKEARARIKAVAKFAYPVVRFSNAAAMDAPFPTAIAPENNLPLLIKAARWGGYFNVLPDYDGVVRRLPLVMRCKGEYFPSLALVTLARFMNQSLPDLQIRPYGLENIKLGERVIPVDEKGRLRINFRGGAKVVPVVEACDVLTGKAKPGALKGKAVVLTVTAAGVMDHRPTPIAAQMPGGYILAQAMDTILSGDFLVKTNWTSMWDLAAIILAALAAAMLMTWLHPMPGGACSLGLAGAYTLTVYELFCRGMLINLVYPLIALGLAGVGAMLYRYLGEEREKKQIRGAFQHYLNPSVISELLKDPKGLKLGGEKKDLSVLFADIRGFTTISEKLEPDVLASVLNSFMDRMTQAVFDNDGVLDKYIGDAVMAFFGAPVAQPDHAAKACATALAMIRQVDHLRPQWQELGVADLSLGVGVNSGPMVVGNMGSHMRFDYTVIGDNVNLGSRLEGQTKEYGVSVVVSQSTRDAASDAFWFRILDLIRVKGKTKPVAIHELVAEKSTDQPAWLPLAEDAFAAYLARDFSGAAALYEQVLALKPNDACATQLLERCRAYAENPPSDDWDGAMTKTSK